MKTDRISNAQISKIWATAKEKSIDKEDVYAFIYQIAKQDSMRKLTKEQANEVIDRLTGGYGGRTSTEAMRRKIYALTVELGWSENPKRLAGFCKKMFRIDRVEWLSKKQCFQLIEALKKISERGK